MNAVTGFISIVSLLLALATGGTATAPQAGATDRKAGDQQENNLVKSSKLATNHNETFVRYTAAMD